MQNFKNRFICLLKGGHRWDKYSGWYQEKPAEGARCENCGTIFHRHQSTVEL